MLNEYHKYHGILSIGEFLTKAGIRSIIHFLNGLGGLKDHLSRRRLNDPHSVSNLRSNELYKSVAFNHLLKVE